MDVKFNNEVFELIAETDKDYLVIGENHFKIHDGELFRNCFVTEDENNILVFIEGRTYHFEKIDEEQDFTAGAGGSTSDREEVKPPMPGSVVKLLVEVGQEVSDGDGLIIVEAMKMETTLYSSISGIVKEVNVKEGEQVDADKIMILVEKE
jgi:biotin carboxyl carrier protein